MLVATLPASIATCESSRDLDLGYILRLHGPGFLKRYGKRYPLRFWKAISAIQNCRTPALGGHRQACGDCGYEQLFYNSCRNRHCPKCQTLDQQRWLEARRQELLPIRYFHVTFTLPEQLRPLALRNQVALYNLLFGAAAETLLELGRNNLGVELGVIAVLHTWSQQLIDHPHLHCIVTGGGPSLDGRRFIHAHPHFLFADAVVAKLFQAKFMADLRLAYDTDQLDLSGQLAPLRDRQVFQNLVNKLYQLDWVIHTEPPADQPDHVIDYLARYTHRVALSNDRILKLEDDQVTFSYLDRQDGNTRKLMTLHVHEFIRRFLLHVLPEGFVKIRYYGILSHRQRTQQLQRCRELLGALPPPPLPTPSWQEQLYRLTGIDPTRCRACGQGRSLYRTELLITAKAFVPE